MATDATRGRGRPRQEFTLDAIGEKVLQELNRRLDSPQEAAEIPGTQLMQIAQRYLAALEKIAQAAAEPEEEDDRLTPLEVIDVPGLSTERKVEILDPYLDRLEAEWREASKRYEEMLNELREKEEADGDAPEVP